MRCVIAMINDNNRYACYINTWQAARFIDPCANFVPFILVFVFLFRNNDLTPDFRNCVVAHPTRSRSEENVEKVERIGRCFVYESLFWKTQQQHKRFA